ncbi:MAG TPA: TIGR04255 family protein [Mycobacteriales bacterium]|nr:TIGR04255 family protein [Mycobacteriales bacterium]
MEEREVYPNASAILVALEVRHSKAEPHSSAQRLKIKRRLAAQVPIVRTGQLTQVTAAMQPAGAPAVAPEVRVEEFPRYFSRDSTAAVSVRAEAIVVETTRYGRWEEFRGLVAAALEARQEVGGIDGVERIGLRYVNEIRVPGELFHDWSPWVDPALLGPAPIGEELGMRTAQWQGVTAFTPAPDRTVVLRYGPRDGFAVDPGGDLKRSMPTPGPFFLIDIDSFWIPGEIPEFDIKTLLTVCDELHAPVRGLFERLITDRLRKEVLRHAD